jgi:hypothetical protein
MIKIENVDIYIYIVSVTRHAMSRDFKSLKFSGKAILQPFKIILKVAK